MTMARITASVYTSTRPAIGAAIDLGKTAETVLAAPVQGLRAFQGVDEVEQARRDLPRLQRPRHCFQP